MTYAHSPHPKHHVFDGFPTCFAPSTIGTMHSGSVCLRSFVDEHRSEAELAETRIARTDTRAADHISVLKKLALCSSLESSVSFLISRRQLSQLHPSVAAACSARDRRPNCGPIHENIQNTIESISQSQDVASTDVQLRRVKRIKREETCVLSGSRQSTRLAELVHDNTRGRRELIPSDDRISENLGVTDHLPSISYRVVIKREEIQTNNDVIIFTATTYLVVQGQEWHTGVNGFSALCTQSHHLQPGAMDLLRQLIDGNVTWSTHQNLPENHQKTNGKKCWATFKRKAWKI